VLTLRIEDLFADSVLEYPLVHQTGKVVLGAGLTLTEGLIEALHNTNIEVLFGVVSTDEIYALRETSATVPMDIASLQPDNAFPTDIYDSDMNLVASEGYEITPLAAEALQQSKRRRFFTFPEDLREQYKRLLCEVDEAVRAHLKRLSNSGRPSAKVRPVGVSVQRLRRRCRPGERSPLEIQADFASCEGVIRDIEEFYKAVGEGLPVKPKRLTEMAERILGIILDDMELAIAFTLQEKRFEFLHVHTFSTALLAAAAGTARNYGRKQLLDLACASLLMHLGMLRLPRQLLDRPRALTQEELAQVREHPRYNLGYAMHLAVESPAVLLAVYEHHERGTGHGYPEGLRLPEIHDYACLLAAADTLDALCRPRPHRPAMGSHEALTTMAKMAKLHMLSPTAVDSLLQAVGNPPLGSYVQLDDGRHARVVSVNPERVDRPKLAVLLDSQEVPLEKPEIVDTSVTPTNFSLRELTLPLIAPQAGF